MTARPLLCLSLLFSLTLGCQRCGGPQVAASPAQPPQVREPGAALVTKDAVRRYVAWREAWARELERLQQAGRGASPAALAQASREAALRTREAAGLTEETARPVEALVRELITAEVVLEETQARLEQALEKARGEEKAALEQTLEAYETRRADLKERQARLVQAYGEEAVEQVEAQQEALTRAERAVVRALGQAAGAR